MPLIAMVPTALDVGACAGSPEIWPKIRKILVGVGGGICNAAFQAAIDAQKQACKDWMGQVDTVLSMIEPLLKRWCS